MCPAMRWYACGAHYILATWLPPDVATSWLPRRRCQQCSGSRHHLRHRRCPLQRRLQCHTVRRRMPFSPWQPPSLLLSPRGVPSEQPAANRGSSRGRASATTPTIRPLVWRLQTRRPIADFLFRRNLNPKGATRETGLIFKASMGFTSVSRSYYYLRRRSPGPPFPPDHRQASGERGAITI
jgi:hypothetical protein